MSISTDAPARIVNVYRHGWILLGIILTGCGGGSVAGPVAVSMLSTEKISYDRKPRPALQEVRFDQMNLTKKGEPIRLNVPQKLVPRSDIVFRGALRYPPEWGQINLIRIEFYEFNRQIKQDVTLNETNGKITNKDGISHFESEVIKTPAAGHSMLRIWGSAIPADYDRDSGIPPKGEHIVLGIADIEIQ